MGVDNPDLDAAVSIFLAIGFQLQQGAEVNHASHTKAHDNTTAAALALHHGDNKLRAGLFEVAVAGDGLDLVRDVVMLEETGQNAAGAERIGLECHEDQDRRRERMSRVLEMGVEFRY